MQLHRALPAVLLFGCQPMDPGPLDTSLAVLRDAASEDAAESSRDGGLGHDAGGLDGGSVDAPPTSFTDSPSASEPDAHRDLAPREDRGLVFRRVGGRTIAGDLFTPGGSTPPATVVIIHGGGFVGGSRSGRSEELWMDHLRSVGIAAFSIDYRVVGDFDAGEIPFDGVVVDVGCALLWLRSHAISFGLDPDRLFVLGSSAGGFLSSHLGATQDEISIADGVCEDGASGTVALRGVITFFGPSDWKGMAGTRASPTRPWPRFATRSSPGSGRVESGEGLRSSPRWSWSVEASDHPLELVGIDDHRTPTDLSRARANLHLVWARRERTLERGVADPLTIDPHLREARGAASDHGQTPSPTPTPSAEPMVSGASGTSIDRGRPASWNASSIATRSALEASSVSCFFATVTRSSDSFDTRPW